MSKECFEPLFFPKNYPGLRDYMLHLTTFLILIGSATLSIAFLALSVMYQSEIDPLILSLNSLNTRFGFQIFFNAESSQKAGNLTLHLNTSTVST